ncbi:MAG: hypothetical protein EXX96DRAFT_566414 [Benjaminiella poitrasii]|nr:MAG: hypothetical protein EXX96DRAFT_566414 [Benjaminiella poitrasii]
MRLFVDTLLISSCGSASLPNATVDFELHIVLTCFLLSLLRVFTLDHFIAHIVLSLQTAFPDVPFSSDAVLHLLLYLQPTNRYSSSRYP